MYHREAAQERFVERMSASNMETVDPVHAETVQRPEGGQGELSLRTLGQDLSSCRHGYHVACVGHFQSAWKGTCLSNDTRTRNLDFQNIRAKRGLKNHFLQSLPFLQRGRQKFRDQGTCSKPECSPASPILLGQCSMGP